MEAGGQLWLRGTSLFALQRADALALDCVGHSALDIAGPHLLNELKNKEAWHLILARWQALPIHSSGNTALPPTGFELVTIQGWGWTLTAEL